MGQPIHERLTQVENLIHQQGVLLNEIVEALDNAGIRRNPSDHTDDGEYVLGDAQ